MTHGRAKVRVHATDYAMKFKDSFVLRRNAWAIISDYANLFAHIYKQRKQLNLIRNSNDAPVSLELIVHAFGEIGKPIMSFSC